MIGRIARLSFELGLAAIEPRSLTASRLSRLKLYKFDQFPTQFWCYRLVLDFSIRIHITEGQHVFETNPKIGPRMN